MPWFIARHLHWYTVYHQTSEMASISELVFRGTALEERTCRICNSQSVEDEFHFILICNEYDELRINLFNSIKYKLETFEYLDNREKFVHIMKYEWKLLLKQIPSKSIGKTE